MAKNKGSKRGKTSQSRTGAGAPAAAASAAPVELKSAATPHRVPYVALTLVALAGVLMLARLHTYDEPYQHDITNSAVIAHEMLEGRQLYTDLWNHKLPTLYYIHAAFQVVFGYGHLYIYLLSVLTATATMLGVYWGVSHLGGKWAGVWAAAFWVVLSGDMYLQGNEPNAEVFINPCTAWVFALWVRSTDKGSLLRFAAIGAIAAFAQMIKPVDVAAPILLAVVHVIAPPAGLRRRRALAQVGVMTAVVLAAWGAVFGYYRFFGPWEAFYGTVVAFNQHYVGDASENVREMFSAARLLDHRLKPLVPLVVLTLPAAVWLTLRNRRQGLLLIALLVSGLIGVALPGLFWTHYYQLLFPRVVIGAGACIALLIVAQRQGTWPAPRWAPHAVAGLAMVALLSFEAPNYLRTPEEWSRTKYGMTFVNTREMARQLDMVLEPDEIFYEWGAESGLYFWSDRSPPTGVIFNKPLVQGPLQQELAERVIADLERAQPEIILLNVPRYPLKGPVIDWVNEHYVTWPKIRRMTTYRAMLRRGGRLAHRQYEGYDTTDIRTVTVKPKKLGWRGDAWLDDNNTIHCQQPWVQIRLALPEVRFAYAARLTYVLDTEDDAREIMFTASYTVPEMKDKLPLKVLDTYLVAPGPQPQTSVIWIGAEANNLVVCPSRKQPCTFKFVKLELLVPPDHETSAP